MKLVEQLGGGGGAVGESADEVDFSKIQIL
jgi:hypothetical protein